MADYIQLEVSTDKILLENDSGFILLESSPDEDNEVTITDELRIDTWEWDSPEPNPEDRDPIDYYIAWQLMDNGSENLDKRIEAYRLNGKISDNGKFQIHAIAQGGAINRDDIDNGDNAVYEKDLDDMSNILRGRRIKEGPKNMSLWCPRISGTWDGVGDPDRIDEVVIEVSVHGAKT